MNARILTFVVILGWAGVVAAQTAPPAPADAVAVSATGAAAEEAQPRKGFFAEFGHGLVDTTKHIPRRNSLYWLGGGIGLAFAVHPIDNTFNQRLANDHKLF